MVDRNRVLIKLEELERYLSELKSIFPADFEKYQHVAVKRACERLLQLSIESTIDVCKKLLIGNRLGIPQDEMDLFDKLAKANVFSQDVLLMLKQMRNLRNILVHEYTEIDDKKVFEIIEYRLNDFVQFKQQVLNYIK